MFYGREKELASLQNLYTSPGLQMTVIYGRRRIGKSTLISEFIRDKKAIYYTATKVGAARNLELLARQIRLSLAPDFPPVAFHTIEDLFDFMTRMLPEEKTVFIIDELPYWAEKDESLLSTLQKYVDNDWAKKELLIILCGSALSFMQDKVLSEKSPLFGKRSSQIRLEPFDYLDSGRFVPNYTNEEKAICYGVTGGVAKYLSLFDPARSLDENIQRLFFSPDGFLYDEPRNLLSQEFSDISLLNNIIEQIASGETSLRTIADKVHEKDNTVLYSLEKLIQVGLVGKKCCITEEKNRKKVQYVLKDHMFRFWYQFIPGACSLIEIGMGAQYYTEIVKPRIHSYMGRIFEEMCILYTLREGASGRFGCFLTNAGSWWGMEHAIDPDGKKMLQPADVDIVGLSAANKVFLTGECKFRNEKADRAVFDILVRRTRAIPTDYRHIAYLLFSLGGYTEWYLQELPKDLYLFTLDDLYR